MLQDRQALLLPKNPVQVPLCVRKYVPQAKISDTDVSVFPARKALDVDAVHGAIHKLPENPIVIS
jgi:hypothetical protein